MQASGKQLSKKRTREMTVLSHFPGDIKAGTGNRTLVREGGSCITARFLKGSVWVGLGRSGPVWKKKEKEEEKEKEKGKEKLMVCKSESPGLPRWQAGGFVYVMIIRR